MNSNETCGRQLTTKKHTHATLWISWMPEKKTQCLMLEKHIENAWCLNKNYLKCLMPAKKCWKCLMPAKITQNACCLQKKSNIQTKKRTKKMNKRRNTGMNGMHEKNEYRNELMLRNANKNAKMQNCIFFEVKFYIFQSKIAYFSK